MSWNPQGWPVFCYFLPRGDDEHKSGHRAEKSVVCTYDAVLHGRMPQILYLARRLGELLMDRVYQQKDAAFHSAHAW